MTLEKEIHKKRVLISAYAISPSLGSEWRSAWELLKQLSLEFEVTLLYGNSDGIHGATKFFDDYKNSQHVGFKSIKIESTKFHSLVAKLIPKFISPSIFYPALIKSWNKRAYDIAKALHDECPFDAAHQLGPIGFRNPGYLWKLNCKTYWGPVGGAQYINLKLIKNKFTLYFVEAMYRNISVRLQAFRPYVYKAARNYDKISFATIENKEYFSKFFDRTGPIISDQGLDIITNQKQRSVANFSDISVAWVGSLTARKNIDLLFDIILKAPSWVLFNIYGGGDAEDKVSKLVCNMENVRFHGHISREALNFELLKNDGLLITSHSEANTASLFEAIQCDCIPIAPKRNGFATVLNKDVAFYIDVENYNKSIDDAIHAFNAIKDIEIKKVVLKNLISYKKKITWRALARLHAAQYE